MSRKKTHTDYIEELKQLGISVTEIYRGCNVKIKHVCPVCQRTDWEVLPNHILTGKAKMCRKCQKDNWAKEYQNKLKRIGIKLIGTYINKNTEIYHECPECKRKDWLIQPVNVIHDHMYACEKCRNTRYTDESYKIKAKKLGVKAIGKFINVETPIEHECTICKKTDWMVRPMSVLYNRARMCADCRDKLNESAMAIVLKQVLKHEYPDTIFEYDAGYRGPSGGISKYDIYIPHLNTLIECQSEYHDKYERWNIDELKKKYALKNGFEFVEMDNRQYTPLEAIQKFFNNTNYIPEYVKYKKSTRINFSLADAEKLLNSGKSIQQVADTLGVTYNTIYCHTRTGNLPRSKFKNTSIKQGNKH